MDQENRQLLAEQILLCCRNELYYQFPLLDGAFASLPGKVGDKTRTVGTDGEYLYGSPDYLTEVFADCPARLRRGYLHILLHCLYLHPFRRQGRDVQKWNLACDMAAEQILQKEAGPRLEIPPDPVKDRCLEILGPQPLGAEQIYELLDQNRFPEPIPKLEAAFLFDDHSLWDTLPGGGQEKWEKVLSYTSGNRQRAGKRRGARAGDRQEELEDIGRGVRDYRAFLRQFAVPKEELELDMDSFDYIYYNFGMEQYGNLPLIEPLEYREGHKLEELVIAIDTSGSCDAATVRAFLEETYSILSSHENFFRRMKVYLIQCDCLIQSVAVIHSGEEWKNYSRTITIQGRGGTDFTPVFRYVEEKRQDGSLKHLKALLYFTDGDGAFPRVQPPYDTAFVFLKPNEHMREVPAWAHILTTEQQVKR